MKGCLLIVVLIIGVILIGTLWAWNQWGDRLTSPDEYSLQHTWDKYVKPNIIEDNKDYVVVRYDAKRQAIYDRYNKELQRAKDLGLDTGDLKRIQIAVNVTQPTLWGTAWR